MISTLTAKASTRNGLKGLSAKNFVPITDSRLQYRIQSGFVDKLEAKSARIAESEVDNKSVFMSPVRTHLVFCFERSLSSVRRRLHACEKLDNDCTVFLLQGK